MAANSPPPLSSKALDRFIQNPYLDADPFTFILSSPSSPPSLSEDLVVRFTREAERVAGHIAARIEESPKFAQKPDVYTGVGGLVYMYLEIHFHNKTAAEGQIVRTQPSSPLQFARLFLNKSAKDAESFSEKPSLLCGRPGYYALLAVLEHEDGHPDLSAKALDKLLRLRSLCLPHGRAVCNEHLNGRAGYLAALLYVKRRISKDDILLSAGVEDVVKAILEDGKRFAEEFRNSAEGREWKEDLAARGRTLEDPIFSPLLFPWHDKFYLGCAHGTMGILLTLLDFSLTVPSLTLVEQTVHHIYHHSRFRSGNYSTRHYHNLNDSDDRLVQLCHGATGAVLFFAKAYACLGKEEYRVAAEEAGEVRGNVDDGFEKRSRFFICPFRSFNGI